MSEDTNNEYIKFLKEFDESVRKFEKAEFSIVIRYGATIQLKGTQIAIYNKNINHFETDIRVDENKLEITENTCEEVKKYVLNNLSSLAKCIPSVPKKDDRDIQYSMKDDSFCEVAVNYRGFIISLSGIPAREKIVAKIIDDINKICNIKQGRNGVDMRIATPDNLKDKFDTFKIKIQNIIKKDKRKREFNKFLDKFSDGTTEVVLNDEEKEFQEYSKLFFERFNRYAYIAEPSGTKKETINAIKTCLKEDKDILDKLLYPNFDEDMDKKILY